MISPTLRTLNRTSSRLRLVHTTPLFFYNSHCRPYLKRSIRYLTMAPRQTAPSFVPKPLSWCLDGRETDLLHYVFSRPDLEELRGSPSKVLRAIDDYSEQYKFLMNIGPMKGAYIRDLIAKTKPSVMIELGGYVGYSAILFGDAARASGGKQYLSLEVNPEMAAISNVLVELAGLRDFVRIVIGPSNESLVRLIKDEKRISVVELIFIDHWQELYLPDLLLLEELNVLKAGVSTLVADNVITPGAPEYQKWLRASPAQKKEMTNKKIADFENNGQPSSTFAYARVVGNPNLIYQTAMEVFSIDGRQDGVEVTKVVGGDVP